jgi:hypothetical protein
MEDFANIVKNLCRIILNFKKYAMIAKKKDGRKKLKKIEKRQNGKPEFRSYKARRNKAR